MSSSPGSPPARFLATALSTLLLKTRSAMRRELKGVRKEPRPARDATRLGASPFSMSARFAYTNTSPLRQRSPRFEQRLDHLRGPTYAPASRRIQPADRFHAAIRPSIPAVRTMPSDPTSTTNWPSTHSPTVIPAFIHRSNDACRSTARPSTKPITIVFALIRFVSSCGEGLHRRTGAAHMQLAKSQAIGSCAALPLDRGAIRIQNVLSGRPARAGRADPPLVRVRMAAWISSAADRRPRPKASSAWTEPDLDKPDPDKPDPDEPSVEPDGS